MDLLSGLAVVAVALFLLAQATLAMFSPATVRRFLAGFASTPKVHFTELTLRVVAGAAFLHYAPHMQYPQVFQLFGLVLLATTAALFFVPWQLHRRFAQWAVPLATRVLAPYALGSAIAGGFILYAVIAGT